MPNPALTRRRFVQVAGLTATALVLGGCSADEPEPTIVPDKQDAAEPTPEPATAESAPNPEPAPEPAAEPEPEPEAAPAAGNSLIAYFSVSGNTAAVADALAAETGAPLFAIIPVDEYTAADTAYNDDSSRTSLEQAERDTIVVDLVQETPDHWESYDVVYLGFPIWWGAQAWPINQFLRANDFSGKTIVPFCTSGSSPMVPSASLEAFASGGSWAEGPRVSSASNESEIEELVARAS